MFGWRIGSDQQAGSDLRMGGIAVILPRSAQRHLFTEMKMWAINLRLKQPSDCLARFHLKPTEENLNYLLRMPRMTISCSLRRERAVACHRFGEAFNGDGHTRTITNAQGTVTG